MPLSSDPATLFQRVQESMRAVSRSKATASYAGMVRIGPEGSLALLDAPCATAGALQAVVLGPGCEALASIAKSRRSAWRHSSMKIAALGLPGALTHVPIGAGHAGSTVAQALQFV